MHTSNSVPVSIRCCRRSATNTLLVSSFKNCDTVMFPRKNSASLSNTMRSTVPHESDTRTENMNLPVPSAGGGSGGAEVSEVGWEELLEEVEEDDEEADEEDDDEGAEAEAAAEAEADDEVLGTVAGTRGASLVLLKSTNLLTSLGQWSIILTLMQNLAGGFVESTSGTTHK